MLISKRYYEGKEFETSLKEKRPGDLSPELIEALSIPPLAPPPWLISMQRFGPPPSYPTLRIPGLNAPLPQGYVFALAEYHVSCLVVRNGASILGVGENRLWTSTTGRCMEMYSVCYQKHPTSRRYVLTLLPLHWSYNLYNRLESPLSENLGADWSQTKASATTSLAIN
jgi:hypothetical protein